MGTVEFFSETSIPFSSPLLQYNTFFQELRVTFLKELLPSSKAKLFLIFSIHTARQAIHHSTFLFFFILLSGSVTRRKMRLCV